MLHANPDRIRIVFDDHRLVANAGLLLGHPRPASGACGNSLTITLTWAARRGGPTPETTDEPQPHCRRRRCVAHRGDGLHPGRHGQGAIHPGDLPAQLPVGPRPPAGPGEPGAAGPGLGRWGRTRRRAVHHRPRHHLRERTGQGGRPPPAIPASGATSCWPSPPAPETC